MKNKFKIIFGLLILVMLGLIVMINYYNKPHVNVKVKAADYELTSQNLLKEYGEDEVKTDKKYSDKIIQIEGEVNKISTHKGASVITLKNKHMESSVICHMQPEENIKSLGFKKGQSVQIRGICTGYLLDVIMVKCVFVK